MAAAIIPVDLTNPGQVFACLGFMEAAEVLCGGAVGAFAWSAGDARFELEASGDTNPFEAALDFVCDARATEYSPDLGQSPNAGPSQQCWSDDAASELGATFPAARAENLALPVWLTDQRGHEFFLSHWADRSSRDSFKLYSGNRSAFKVVSDMKSLVVALRDSGQAVAADPLNAICDMGGSFNFDPRGAWNALDAGYSLDRLGHSVQSSPVVELFSAMGLENSRPARCRFQEGCSA